MRKEMEFRHRLFTLCAVFVLILFPLAAGCLSVPGPENQKKTPAVTAVATRSPQTTSTAATLQQSLTVTPARTLVVTTTPSSAVTSPITAGYAPASCQEQGGYIVLPGQQCTGSWLAAINTFSCCSVPPVKGGDGTGTISVAPFTLTVNTDDSLGSIGP